MLIARVLHLIEQAGLSPEQAALRLGVSHMTLRRWRRRPAGIALWFYRKKFPQLFKKN